MPLLDQGIGRVSVQEAGRLTANFRPAAPLTPALFQLAFQAEIACDERASCRVSRSGLAVVATRGQTVHPGPAAGERAAPQPTHRPGQRTGQPARADRPQLAQLAFAARLLRRSDRLPAMGPVLSRRHGARAVAANVAASQAILDQARSCCR